MAKQSLILRVTGYLEGLRKTSWEHDYDYVDLADAEERFRPAVEKLIGWRFDTIVAHIQGKNGSVLGSFTVKKAYVDKKTKATFDE